MPRRFSFRCTQANNSTVEVCGELTDADVELLSEFLEYVERLRQTQLVRSHFTAGLHVATRRGDPLQIESDLPERTQFAEFIHEMRPFVLENERTYFYKIAGILGRAAGNDCVFRVLRVTSDRFSGRAISEMVRITVGDRHITSDAFVRDWMNAFEYHHDRATRTGIEAAHAAVPLEATESIVVMLLIDKANAINYLGRVVELCLRDRPTDDAERPE